MLKGSIVALITPFEDNQIDVDVFRQLILWHLTKGTTGFVICGTTGEAAALTQTERDTLISVAVETVKGKVPVLVGCGSASTQQAIEWVNQAKTHGANGALVVAPYYVKPTQQGLIQHFTAIHNATDLPIVLYNNPARTVVDMEISTIEVLSRLPRVVGLKESKPDVARITLLREAIGNDFALLSGEDSVIGAHMLYGADGAISVVANVMPELCAAQMTAWFTQDMPLFTTLTHKLIPLIAALSQGSNPCTIKYALHVARKGYQETVSDMSCLESNKSIHLLHAPKADVRLPLTEIPDIIKINIENALSALRK